VGSFFPEAFTEGSVVRCADLSSCKNPPKRQRTANDEFLPPQSGRKENIGCPPLSPERNLDRNGGPRREKKLHPRKKPPTEARRDQRAPSQKTPLPKNPSQHKAKKETTPFSPEERRRRLRHSFSRTDLSRLKTPENHFEWRRVRPRIESDWGLRLLQALLDASSPKDSPSTREDGATLL